MTTLSDTLRQNLHAALVGRDAERALVAEALRAAELPFHVVHLYGPGGVGKTTLLHAFERLAVEAGVPAALLDMRDLEATPEGLARAVDAAFAGAPEGGRRLLLLDTFEAAQGLDGWLQRVFLPERSDELLVVIAGRNAPDPAWTADAAWAAAVRALPLGNLSAAETEAFLDGRNVPAADRAGVAAFTHGYPLALALVAERMRQRPGAPFVPSEAPDIVHALLERFVRDVPSPRHRTAIEGAALVRVVTEPLLAALLGDDATGAPDPHTLFGWLRGLTFVDDGPRGLVLHDVAREAVEADLRWRDAACYARLHARARRHYTALLLADGTDLPVVLGDYVHLYRDNPVVQPLLGSLAGAWRTADVRQARPMRPADVPALVAMVRQHEGEAAVAIAERWFAVQPTATEVFDAADGTPAGFLTALALDDAEARDRDADPLARAAWSAVEGTRRPGERVLLFRFWMDAGAYQGLSAVQSLVFARTVRHYLTTPRLAVSLLPVADPDLWAPVLAFAGLARWPEAEASVGGHAYAVFGMDWRAVPPAAWLDALAARVPSEVPEAPGAQAGRGPRRPLARRLRRRRPRGAQSRGAAAQDGRQPAPPLRARRRRRPGRRRRGPRRDAHLAAHRGRADARGSAARAPVLGRAPADVPHAGPEPGHRLGAPRRPVQLLPPAPRARHRPRRGRALAPRDWRLSAATTSQCSVIPAPEPGSPGQSNALESATTHRKTSRRSRVGARDDRE